MAVLQPPEIFMHCANTVAAHYADVPPFATYHVHTDLHFLKKDSVFEKTVSVRLGDQVAIVHDEKTNSDVLRPPFPAPPNLDFLGTFQMSGFLKSDYGGKHTDIDFRFANVEPVRYEETVRRDNVVVARALKGYAIAVVDDAGERITHLKFAPGPSALGERTWFKDVYIDKSTDLPIRIVKGEQYGTIIADYQTVQGHWLLKTFTMDNNYKAFGMISIAGRFVSTFDDYLFSDTAPDPRLVPGAMPIPTPKGGVP